MATPMIPSMFMFLPMLLAFLARYSLVRSFELLSADHLPKYYQILLPKVVGPESIAFDCQGRGPYVGTSDGRVLKWQGSPAGWTEFAYTAPRRNRRMCDGSTNPRLEQTCGRPLGLKFNNVTCELYIADAYYGLLKVGPRGGVARKLAASADGIPFRLTNALDIDTKTGVVYFTDSSRFYQRWEFVKLIESGDSTGRVLKYDPRTNEVTTLLKGLSFPNGIALSKDKTFLVVAETGNLQVIRLWLTGIRGGMSEPFAQLARYPDNIKATENGGFWVALNSMRGVPMRSTDSSVMMEKKAAGGSGSMDESIPWFTGDPVGIKFGEDGSTLQVLDGMNGKRFESVSELLEFGGTLWVGSVVTPYVGKFKS